MTPHDHTTRVPGCYRCELGQDEARDAMRDEAVCIVDARHGYTVEFAPDTAAHRAEYDEEADRLATSREDR